MWFLEADVNHVVGTHWAVTAGIRYFELEHSEEFPDRVYPQGWPRTTISWNHAWLDPVVGATFSCPLASEWDYSGRGDIGGFGIGSDLTSDLGATVQWALAPHIALIGGYRVFHVDCAENQTYTSSDGGRITLAETYDTRTNGPVLGLTMQW
jgi:hypothetical protein